MRVVAQMGMVMNLDRVEVEPLRYLGLLLYDADRVGTAYATRDDGDVCQAHLDMLLDPHDPQVVSAVRRDGIPNDWLAAARRSPVYALVKRYRVALPLLPEDRTMPMVWYVPALSALLSAPGPDIDDSDMVSGVLRRLAAMRSYMRGVARWGEGDHAIAESIGMSEHSLFEMFRLLAIAKHEERYVIPTAHRERAIELEKIGWRAAG